MWRWLGLTNAFLMRFSCTAYTTPPTDEGVLGHTKIKRKGADKLAPLSRLCVIVIVY